MDQFILFGDSITQQAFSADHGFFGPALSDAYVRRLDVINRGFSGYNTSQALQILPKFMPSPGQAGVRFLTIFFGANDSRLPNTPFGPQQHVPLDEYTENLRAIATHPCVRAHHSIRIMLVTPPPVDERMLMQSDKANHGQATLRRTANTTATYAARVRQVGKELNIPVLDMWTSLIEQSTTTWTDASIPGAKDAAVNEKLQSFVRDGLHLTRAGYRIMFEELLNLIEKTWPDQMPDRLPLALPAWDDEPAWRSASAGASL